MKYLILILLVTSVVACNNKEHDKWQDSTEQKDGGDTIELSEENLDTCQCDSLSFDDEGLAILKNDEPFSGKCHSYNKANGNKYEERLYLDGVVNWIKFYNNAGDLITQYDYVDGKRKELVANCDCNSLEYKKKDGNFVAYYDGNIFDGHCRSFYPQSARIYQEGKFVQGIKEGMHAVYDKSGNILKFEYYENGKLTKRSRR